MDVKGKRRIEREKKDLSFTGQMEHRSKRAISKLFFFFFNFMTLTTFGNNQGPLMGEWPRTLQHLVMFRKRLGKFPFYHIR